MCSNTIPELRELEEKKNVRANLSHLRRMAKEEEYGTLLRTFAKENTELLISFLSDEDAKTRKNAALLLGDLQWHPAEDAIYEAYNIEETRFVRSSYLQALADMGYTGHNEELHARLDELLAQPEEEESRKHNEEELRQLRRILLGQEGITRHHFEAKGRRYSVLLTTNREHKEFICRKVPVGRASVHPLGVLVETERLEKLLTFRLYREMLILIAPQEGRTVSAEPREAAQQLAASDLYEQLLSLHKEAGAFYFRLEVRSPMTLEERSEFARTLAAELEKRSEGRLINSTSDYEVELRLIATRNGGYLPCIRLYTLPDKRFSYRKNAIGTSIHPSNAALMMELAAPYLKEGAQIMDPFCGVGTMLIERNYHTHAGDMYATDIFEEAIEKGRENAEIAKMHIHFIHRSFFEFTHEYSFDELISDMPTRGKKTREEMDQLYQDFFDKAGEICTNGAKLILYSNEEGFLKKQLRLRRSFRLLKEFPMQAKGEFSLYIIEYRR